MKTQQLDCVDEAMKKQNSVGLWEIDTMDMCKWIVLGSIFLNFKIGSQINKYILFCLSLDINRGSINPKILPPSSRLNVKSTSKYIFNIDPK